MADNKPHYSAQEPGGPSEQPEAEGGNHLSFTLTDDSLSL